MKQHKLFVAVFALLLSAPGLPLLRAADVTWDGSDNMTWTQPDATSWSGATYESGDTALFTGSSQGTVTLSGTITPGEVTVSAGAYTFAGSAIGGVGALTVSGGTSTLSNAANTYSGDTIIGVGAELYVYESNRLPYGAGKGDVTVDGTLRFRYTQNYTLNGLNGAGQVVLLGTTWGSGTLTVGSGDASSTFSGVLTNTGSPLYLTKTGSGTVELSGDNIYRGVTTIDDGVLVLSGANTLISTVSVNDGATLKLGHTQALDGASQLILAAGATVDVTTVSYVLGNAQKLKLTGYGAAATLATDSGNGLALGTSGSLHFSAYDGATPPLTVSGAGSFTLSSGNTVTITVAGTTNALAVGDYTLIEDGVAGDAPTTYVNVGGAGRVAATTATMIIDDGNLVLRIADYSPVHAPTSIATAAAGPWDWPATWVGGIVPGPGDSVTVNHAVDLWCGTHELASFVNNTTLTCNGWNAPLRSGDVTINATMTHPAQTATAIDPVFCKWVPDNRVLIECVNLTLNENKAIDTDKMGYRGLYGPGAPINTYAGGSHGGLARSSGGVTYGSVEEPTDPGSGGQYASLWAGGPGGGAIRISASGAIAIHGTITAEGGTGTGVGGSGGSIFMECDTIAGDGVLSVMGGTDTEGRGGGGGRIAVIYDTSSQSNAPRSDVIFKAQGGSGSDLGTLFFSDNQFLFSPMRHSGQWMVPGTTNWSCDDLVFTNASLRFPETGFILNVTNDLVMTGAGDTLQYGLQVSNANITCGGNLTMKGSYLVLASGGELVQSIVVVGDMTITNVGTRGSVMYVYAAMTNGAATPYGALVDVGGTLYVSTNSTIYPDSHGTNGGSVFFSVRSLFLADGGFIDANGRGYNGMCGPGAAGGSGNVAGASYGGLGGSDIYHLGKDTYGFEEWPTDPGSGGGNAGFRGGGLVWIEAAKTMTIDGVIRANSVANWQSVGAGSGGGVAVKCRTLLGYGTITANGGPYMNCSTYNSGGGGRIAIWRMYDKSTGLATNVTAAASTENAEDGTVFWGWLPIPGLRVIFR